jgi:hypothetical protein
MISLVMDNNELAQFFKSNPYAKILLEVLVEEKQRIYHTTIKKAIDIYSSRKINVFRNQVVQLFKQLQRLGCGRFIIGRRGSPSRLRWAVDVATIYKAISSDSIGRENLGSPSSVQGNSEASSPSPILSHQFHLRPDRTVVFDLPSDLNEREAQRLAKFIESLPMAMEK